MNEEVEEVEEVEAERGDDEPHYRFGADEDETPRLSSYRSELEESIAASRDASGEPFGDWERYVLSTGTLPSARARFVEPARRMPAPPEENDEDAFDPKAARAEKRQHARMLRVAAIAALGLVAFKVFEAPKRGAASDVESSKKLPVRASTIVVEAGETPHGVAERAGVDVRSLYAANVAAWLQWGPGLVLSVPRA